ncbi:hypothetical protein DRN84_02760 [Candidatus Geothermarchaeota archaeon]|nr:MAG: hypothetical protein DRN84_02760 [Candidatus Geothermarchaeota archaeon]HEW93285.1 hypothetical protein [Thermoprotei archaeon]
MPVTVSIKVRKEIVELAEKMVRYGIARNRSHAFNILIERGLNEVRMEVEFWDNVYKKADELLKKGYRVRHGGLNKLLEENRSRWRI